MMAAARPRGVVADLSSRVLTGRHMRSIISVLVLVLSISCSSSKSGSSTEPTLPKNTPPARTEPVKAVASNPPATPDIEGFLKAFETAVAGKDFNGLFKLVDPAYKKEQHKRMLKGNTEQFLDELFCGNLAVGKGFKCVKVGTVTALKRRHVKKVKDIYEVEYEVTAGGTTIICTWTLRVRQEEGKQLLGLVGAVG